MIKILLITFVVLFLIDILVCVYLWRVKKPSYYSHLINRADGYEPDRPSICAIYSMSSLLDAIEDFGWESTRIRPIIDGGVSITFQSGQRKCCVEFDSDGDASILFLGDSTPITRYFSGNAAIARAIREFFESVAV